MMCCWSMPQSGKIVTRFDLADHPDRAVDVSDCGDRRPGTAARAFVALWNGSAIAELDLRAGKVVGQAAAASSVGRDPSRFAPNIDGPEPRRKDAVRRARQSRHGGRRPALGRSLMQLARLYDTQLPGADLLRRHARLGRAFARRSDALRGQLRNRLDSGLSHQAREPRRRARNPDWLHSD